MDLSKVTRAGYSVNCKKPLLPALATQSLAMLKVAPYRSYEYGKQQNDLAWNHCVANGGNMFNLDEYIVELFVKGHITWQEMVDAYHDTH